MGGLLHFSHSGSLQFFVALCLMNNLVFHKFIEFPGTFALCQLFPLLRLQPLLRSNDLLIVELVLDPLLVLVSDLLLNSLLRVKHESVDTLGHLLLYAEFLFPPLYK